MDRRDFVKTLPVVTLAGMAAPEAQAVDPPAQAGASATGRAQAATSNEGGVHHLLTKEGGIPKYVQHIRETDMDGIGPDGKPIPGYKAAGTGSTRRSPLTTRRSHIR